MNKNAIIAVVAIVAAVWLYNQRNCNTGCRVAADALLRKGLNVLL